MASRSWKWVLNNYTEKDIELHKMWGKDCKRMRVSKEVGEKGTPHLQCSATFNRAMRASALKKMHPKVHWEIAKVKDGLYEAKWDGEVIIDIDNRRQGERNDITDMVNTIKEGVSKKKLWETHPETMMKFHRGAYEMMKVIHAETVKSRFELNDFHWKPITDWSRSHILWGEAGIGKTQFALAHFKNPLFVSHIDDLAGFDKTEHDGIVFDDMDFGHMPRTAQIHIMDIDEPRSIHIRYGCARIPANTRKIFTTNTEDGAIVNLCESAILRRVTVTEVTEGNTKLQSQTHE